MVYKIKRFENLVKTHHHYMYLYSMQSIRPFEKFKNTRSICQFVTPQYIMKNL